VDLRAHLAQEVDHPGRLVARLHRHPEPPLGIMLHRTDQPRRGGRDHCALHPAALPVLDIHVR
jgi:hypothetical protein